MEFIRFLHIQMSSRRRNKAKTLRWNHCDRVLDRFDIKYGHGKSGPMDTGTLSTARVEENDTAASLGIHDLYQIHQVLSLHIPQWSSNDALTVWWNLSGRFLGPIK